MLLLFPAKINYFNSTIVRLKLDSLVKQNTIFEFQFYNSSIKTKLHSRKLFAKHHFNSTIVRLKPNGLGIMFSYVLLFQFYNSSIKTDTFPGNIKDLTAFQFYNSSIKTFCLPFFALPFLRFQFYNSSIKTFCSKHKNFLLKYFNSTIVRLKQ